MQNPNLGWKQGCICWSPFSIQCWATNWYWAFIQPLQQKLSRYPEIFFFSDISKSEDSPNVHDLYNWFAALIAIYEVHIYQNLHDQWKLTKINQKQLESSQSNWNWIICLCIGAASVPDEVLNLFRSLPPISPSSPPPFSIDPNGGKLIRAKVGCTNGISWLANPPHSCQSSTGQVYLDSGFA